MPTIDGAKYRWHLPTTPVAMATQVSATHNLPIPLVHLLLSRGFDNHEKINNFLFTPEPSHVAPAHLLYDAQKAVERIKQAIDKNEKILIVGDYDVDGMSATALMMLCLLPLTKRINYFLPHRVHDGYGLSASIIAKAAHSGYTLVITVDNGITAFQASEAARVSQIDLIITDHHQPVSMLPIACAIVNPVQKQCAYPHKELAGVGVAFKLMSLLYEFLGRCLPEKVYELLMLGTIADVVPLIDENRYWVRWALARAQQKPSLSLTLLKRNAGIADEKVLSATDIAFLIAPQLNALGRLQDPRQGVHFLMSNDREQLEPIAQLLAELNSARKEIERTIVAEIHESIAQKNIDIEKEYIILAAQQRWPQGIIGLVASRLVAEYARPALLFHLTHDGMAKGSGRSIATFNLFHALNAISHIKFHFGGHAQAVGVSMQAELLGTFKNALEEIMQQTMTPEDLVPQITLDAQVQLGDLNGHFVDSLAYLAPFGCMNREPLFYISDVCLVDAPQLLKGMHTKCRVFAQGIVKPIIFFNRPDIYSWLCERHDHTFSLAAQVTENYWQGMRSVELQGLDIAQGKI